MHARGSVKFVTGPDRRHYSCGERFVGAPVDLAMLLKISPELMIAWATMPGRGEKT
jgi:hypothetical protein